MFDFGIINLSDGNQIIDRNLKTPYKALTPLQMAEYIEMDVQVCIYGQNGTGSKGRSRMQTETCTEAII